MEKEKQITDLQTANSKLEGQMEVLKKQVEDLSQTNKQFEKDLEAKKGQLETITVERDQLKADLEAVKNENKATFEAKENVEKALAEAQKTIKAYREKEVESKNTEIAGKIDAIPGLTDEQKNTLKGKFVSVLGEDGNIQFDHEEYNFYFNNLPEVKATTGVPDPKGEALISASNSLNGASSGTRGEEDKKLKSDRVW